MNKKRVSNYKFLILGLSVLFLLLVFSFSVSGVCDGGKSDGFLGKNNGPSLEECDGSDLGGTTCKAEGFDSGTLTCTPTCTLDTSGCSKSSNVGYSFDWGKLWDKVTFWDKDKGNNLDVSVKGGFWDGVKDFGRAIVGIETGDDELTASEMWWVHAGQNFVIGFFAAFFIWIVTFVYNLSARWVSSRMGNPQGQIQWLATLAGNFWQVLAFAIIYTALMGVPFLNKFLQIITFRWFGLPDGFLGILAKAFILSVVVGFGPQAISLMIKYLRKQRAMRGLNYQDVGQAGYIHAGKQLMKS